MAPGEPPIEVKSVFDSIIKDETGQPNLTIDSAENHQLIWTLVNNQPGDLVVKPFGNTKVDKTQFHFMFDFSPGALTSAPAVSGWNVFPVMEDGVLKALCIALAGPDTLTLKSGEKKQTTFTYSRAVKKDTSKVTVNVITGTNVSVGGNKMVTVDLDLVKENAPTLSAPPITVDFVGRRIVVNDGSTPNDFTFALTNMMHADIELTVTSAFSVWFDAAPNGTTQGYAWALAQQQDLASENFKLQKPSDDWKITPPLTTTKDVTVSPRWLIGLVKNVILKPQQPVFFMFKGLKTNLPSGTARMYLSFSNVANYRPGVLIGELEKAPLVYGPTGGNVGIGTGETPPAAKLHIRDNVQNTDGGSVIIGSSNPDYPSLRFGFQPGYTWIQSHAGKPLAINPALRNVGIGTSNPGSSLSVAGGVAIGESYAQANSATIAKNNLGVQGRIGINQTNPGSSLAVDGGIAIGTNYSKFDTTIGPNNLGVEGKISINTTTPSALLQISDSKLREKIFNNTTSVGIVQQAAETVGLSLRKFDGNAVVEFRVYDAAAKNEWPNYIQAEKGTGDILMGDTGKTRVARAGWLELGVGLDKKQVDAGKIGYKKFSDALDIVGAGVTGEQGKGDPPRKVRVWDELQTGKLNLTGFLELGYGVADKDPAAGHIAYKKYSQGLDIVGATSDIKTRQVHLWDDVYLHGNFWKVSNGFWTYLEPKYPVDSGSWDYAVFRYSDLKLKSNVAAIDSAIDKVKKLRGCTYQWSKEALDHFTSHIDKLEPADPKLKPEEIKALRDAERTRQLNFLKKPQVGLIAQEVAAVLPEAVTTEKDGFQSVNYNHIIALLVEAVKEQQAEIEKLKQAIAK